MALKGRGKELRRCAAYILEDLGDRCKKWAMNNTNYCYHHTMSIALGKQSDEDKELKRLFPKLYWRRQLRCSCSAYPFPHFIGTGICNWPEPPTHRWIMGSDPDLPFRKAFGHKHPEQRVKEILRSAGIKNKRTSFIRWFRTGRIEPIPLRDLKPQDFTLLEDYMKNYKELEDWSSLPIQEKRKRIKEQILKALKDEYPGLARKQCLKKEYPLSIDLENSADSKDSERSEHVSAEEIRYKIVKENGKWFMVLENGEMLPLE